MFEATFSKFNKNSLDNSILTENSIFQALAGMDHGSAWLPVFECWQRQHPPLSIIV